MKSMNSFNCSAVQIKCKHLQLWWNVIIGISCSLSWFSSNFMGNWSADSLIRWRSDCWCANSLKTTSWERTLHLLCVPPPYHLWVAVTTIDTIYFGGSKKLTKTTDGNWKRGDKRLKFRPYRQMQRYRHLLSQTVHQWIFHANHYWSHMLYY